DGELHDDRDRALHDHVRLRLGGRERDLPDLANTQLAFLETRCHDDGTDEHRHVSRLPVRDVPDEKIRAPLDVADGDRVDGPGSERHVRGRRRRRNAEDDLLTLYLLTEHRRRGPDAARRARLHEGGLPGRDGEEILGWGRAGEALLVRQDLETLLCAVAAE